LAVAVIILSNITQSHSIAAPSASCIESARIATGGESGTVNEGCGGVRDVGRRGRRGVVFVIISVPILVVIARIEALLVRVGEDAASDAIAGTVATEEPSKIQRSGPAGVSLPTILIIIK
jgi:hypothetical protein